LGDCGSWNILVPDQGKGVMEFHGLVKAFRYLILGVLRGRSNRDKAEEESLKVPIIPIVLCGNVQ